MCDEARLIAEQARQVLAFELLLKDIVDAPQATYESLKLRIPVLVTASGRELNWPFSVLDIMASP